MNSGGNGREIHRNGWLRCIPHLVTDVSLAPKAHLENLFVSFCIHDADGPWLEFYDNRHCSIEHRPVAKFSLLECLHISPRLVSSEEDCFEFAVTLKDRVLRLATESQELTLDWVCTLNGKLREKGIFAPRENEYSLEPSKETGTPVDHAMALQRPRQNMPLPPIPPSPVSNDQGAFRVNFRESLRSLVETRASFVRQESTESNASSTSSSLNSMSIQQPPPLQAPQRDPTSPLPIPPSLSSSVASMSQAIYEPIFPVQPRVQNISNLSRTESARCASTSVSTSLAKLNEKRHSYAGGLDDIEPAASSANLSSPRKNIVTQQAESLVCSVRDLPKPPSAATTNLNAFTPGCSNINTELSSPVSQVSGYDSMNSPITDNDDSNLLDYEIPVYTSCVSTQNAGATGDASNTIPLVNANARQETTLNESELSKMNSKSLKSSTSNSTEIVNNNGFKDSLKATNVFSEKKGFVQAMSGVPSSTSQPSGSNGSHLKESNKIRDAGNINVNLDVYETPTSVSSNAFALPAMPARSRHSMAEVLQESRIPLPPVRLRREQTSDSIQIPKKLSAIPSPHQPLSLRNSTVVPIPQQVAPVNNDTHVHTSNLHRVGASNNPQPVAPGPSVSSGYTDNSESLYVEINEPPRVPAAPTLREQQIAKLQREMGEAGVLVKFARKDLQGSLALVEINNAVYIAGWNKPSMRSHLHVGDRLLNIAGRRVISASEAHKTIKQMPINKPVELVLHRIPFGKALAIRRSFPGENLGLIMESGTSEIKKVLESGLAHRHGLTLRTPSVLDGGMILTNWFITEVNNQPINMFYKNSEIEPRLSAVGSDISIVVQPSDFIRAVKKQMKSMWSYKGFIVQ